MNPPPEVGDRSKGVRVAALVSATVVLIAQLFLVAMAGDDVPFHDQWDAEGRRLLPEWKSGDVGLSDLIAPHNEHRIMWTRILSVLLFSANGDRWDPLVQLVASAFLHAACAFVVVRVLVAGLERRAQFLMAAAVALTNLPIAGWHNALWGFQSQMYFAILFSVGAVALILGRRRWLLGTLAAIAAGLSMGAGVLVPIAVLAVTFLAAAASRNWRGILRIESGLMAALLVLFFLARPQYESDVLGGFQAESIAGFLGAWLRLLAWPHSEQPLAALVLNLPLLAAIVRLVLGRREAAAGERVAIGIGLWTVAVAGALAWARGGGDELATGVPSRYVDFLVLLPLANAWCVLAAWEAARRPVRIVAIAWTIFVLVGWFGVSAQMYRRIVLPLAENRTVRATLIQEYRRTRDPATFAGQPRLFMPHPNLEVVDAVLDDPRLRNSFPPTLDRDGKSGPLSRAVRVVLGRHADTDIRDD